MPCIGEIKSSVVKGQAGLGAVHDRLPEFMTEEPLPVIDSIFDVPLDVLVKFNE